MAVLSLGALCAAADSHVGCRPSTPQGKEVPWHDGHLRYGASQPYAEGSCGMPLWAAFAPGDGVPARALVAGRDHGICDGTECGKDVYVAMVAEQGGGVALGKTWFRRSDGACASLGLDGEASAAAVGCRVLTMGSATHGGSRFGWAAVEAAGNSGTTHHRDGSKSGPNRYEAPPHAFSAGNDPGAHGPLYPCRFVDEVAPAAAASPLSACPHTTPLAEPIPLLRPWAWPGALFGGVGFI